MKRILFVLIAMFISTGLSAQESIAVFPFEDLDSVFTRNESIMFYRQFSNEFTNKNAGRFKIVPRQEIEKLINTEAAFQISDFSARAKTAEMERVLNGTQILSGVIGRVQNSINISVSLYTYPELQQLPGGATLRVSNVIELFDKIPDLVQSMQDAIEKSGNGARPQGGTSNRTYNVGDFGPAGGIIFYDKGVFSGGWRYLEAAPVETEVTSIQWGAAYQQNLIGTSTSVGSGKRNTQIIVEHLNRNRESGRAAQWCANLDFDGFKDWFLPSKDELDLMYKNLKVKGLGGFGNGWYWSSSQSHTYSAWYQYFSDGSQTTKYKDYSSSVRAVRAF